MSNRLSAVMSFSDEQAMLLDTAAQFCKKVSPIDAVRELLVDDRGYAQDVWQETVALGWSGIAIPEEYGGSGLGLPALVPVVESMGRHLLATPFVASQLAVQALTAGGSDEQKSHWLPKLADGAEATVALTEEDGDWHLNHINASFRDGVLSGQKSLVVDAQVAQLIVVSLDYSSEPCLALIPRADIPDSHLSRETVIDETRRSFSLKLDGLNVADDQLITGANATHALAAIERAAWLMHSADACGGTNSTIDLVVEYLNTRVQFGHKIGSYQALKHPTVDMLTGLERARSHVYHAASLIAAEAEETEIDIALRMAKAASGDAYNFAADRAIQFHGGFGFTYECDAQLYLRRALWLQYQFGDGPHHRAALQSALLDE